MVNPLTRLAAHHRAYRIDSQRRRKVPVPVDDSSLDVLQLALRRMRGPILLVIAVFAISVVGLSLMPGLDEDGQPYRMTIFDSLYFMSYTATTIGFGETPYTFTIPQRLWVTGSIFASVAAWSYALTALISQITAPGFRKAMSVLRVKRKLHRTREPFYIVVGNGQTGNAVVDGLVAIHRDAVVVDRDVERLERLTMGSASGSVLGLHADARRAASLGTAGLGSPHCHGVLAMTNDDETNLSIVMTVNLLRPDVPVIARAQSMAMAERMQDFYPEHVVNPMDEFGSYLALRLEQPVTHRLTEWLMSPPGTELEEAVSGLAGGRWVVVSDGEFGEEVARDLRRIGLEAELAPPTGATVDVSEATGVVVGAESDTVNMSVAARVRAANPDCFLVLRQKSLTAAATVRAFAPDLVFHPAELVAHEAMTYLVSPNYWHFVRKVMERDDDWAAEETERIVERVGTGTPEAARLSVTEERAPALTRWLAAGTVTLGQLLTHPESGECRQVYAAVHARGSQRTVSPGDDLQLRVGDTLMVLGTPAGLDGLTATLYDDSAVEHLATGVHVPRTWVFRLFSHRAVRRAHRRRRAARAGRAAR
ncbi:Ion channel [Kytococcus aerolatus]|uniref:Ion channel n=1 Tax=Kytococcus aerolatus TaxID=592308 RepID=A0A212U623_9MICO|nr:NAD-binding protein [Kytococcus aerolatus]SNC73715.1 Ion channel [Kytococcus aerolatus]